MKNLTEDDEEAVPLLGGYGSSYEGMLSPFPHKNKELLRVLKLLLVMNKKKTCQISMPDKHAR